MDYLQTNLQSRLNIYTEQRRYVRVIWQQEIEYKKENSQIMYMCTTDISIGGIGATTDEQLNINDIITICLRLDDEEYSAICRVAYCACCECEYKIGLEFQEAPRELMTHIKKVVARYSVFGKNLR